MGDFGRAGSRRSGGSRGGCRFMGAKRGDRRLLTPTVPAPLAPGRTAPVQHADVCPPGRRCQGCRAAAAAVAAAGVPGVRRRGAARTRPARAGGAAAGARTCKRSAGQRVALRLPHLRAAGGGGARLPAAARRLPGGGPGRGGPGVPWRPSELRRPGEADGLQQEHVLALEPSPDPAGRGVAARLQGATGRPGLARGSAGAAGTQTRTVAEEGDPRRGDAGGPPGERGPVRRSGPAAGRAAAICGDDASRPMGLLLAFPGPPAADPTDGTDGGFPVCHTGGGGTGTCRTRRSGSGRP
jgi:hypothetical protein